MDFSHPRIKWVLATLGSNGSSNPRIEWVLATLGLNETYRRLR